MAFLIGRTKKFLQLCACVLVLTLNSCVYMVVAGVGAVGGYAISPDTVQGMITNHDPAEVWAAADDVVRVMGMIEERNEAAGIMLCKIQGATVTISVTRMSEATVQLKVKARKSLFPRVKIAEDVYLKIHKEVSG